MGFRIGLLETKKEKEMKHEEKEKKTGIYLALSIGIGGVLMLPVLFGLLIAKGFNNLRLSRITKEKKLWVNLILLGVYISLTTIAFVLLYFLGNQSSVNKITWYWPFIPFATEVLSTIQILHGGVDVVTTLLFVLWGMLPTALFIFVILILGRDSVIGSYSREVAAFEKKMAKDIVSEDPSKLSPGRKVSFFIFSVQQDKITSKHLSDKEWTKERKTSVMLDANYGIPVKSLTTHLAIVGTTGSGKTETMYKFIRDAIRRKKPVIFVDGKGDKGNIFRLRKMAEESKRDFHCFSLNASEIVSDDGTEKITPVPYNPFASKNAGMLVDGIMALFDYSEEHYKAGARVYMDIMIQTLVALELKISWESIMKNLNIYNLKDNLKLRYGLEKEEEQKEKETTFGTAKEATNEEKENKRKYDIDVQQLNSIDDKAISGFSSRVGMFYNSTKETIKGEGFELEKVISDDAVVIFSLNSLDYQEQATAIGKLIVNNIKASAEANSTMNKQTLIALDEFNVFADENIIDILNKTRSKGMEVILAFQSISDLSKVSDDFLKQVIENTNNKIVHATNDPDGAEYLAKVLGTKKKVKKTYAEESDGLSGGASTRVVDEFVAHPNELKSLKQGECFVKYIDAKGNKVTTPKIKIERYLDK